ncbi:MAG: metal ABC transporter permease [Phycisphaerales bacterium]|nr:metal ABC transporter permease [Phycisphaerales bacterium]
MSEAEAAWIGDPHALRVIATTALLGASSGAIGTMLTLRSRALVGDAVGHSTLPGLAGASLAGIALGGTGRELWLLMPGAVAGACTGIACVHALQRALKMSADAAMAVTLGTLFGLGVALLSVVQQAPGGHQAGLDGLLVGRAATLVTSDLLACAVLAAMTLALFALCGRDLRALAFDEPFARMVGRPVSTLSALVSAVVVCAIVAGTHAVGLVLVVALLVMPATAARMLSDRYTTVVAAAAALGALGAAAGTVASATRPGLATGPLIVIACAAILAVAVAVRRIRGARGSMP